MKNQYFGDINDYKKYAILRALTANTGITCSICWMLTKDDGGTDGNFTRYLKNPNKWRSFDPDLFDWLAEHFKEEPIRQVSFVEQSNLLQKCNFYSRILQDSLTERRNYFNDLKSVTQSTDLIFFDPDNGIEVNSKPYGTKNSSKYLYWRELNEAFRDGASVLVYQHFPRISHETFISKTILEIKEKLIAQTVVALYTERVVYFLILQDRHHGLLSAANEVAVKWGKEIRLSK